MKGPREVMSRQPGTIYVYRSYGIHTCLNIVGHRPGETGGILIRAIEPTEGVEQMRARRGNVPDRQLGRGPGNVGKALGVLLSDLGDDLFDGDVFTLEHGDAEIVWSGPRIGISKAVDHPWRFFDPISACVSAHSRGEPTTIEGVRVEISNQARIDRTEQ
jgi:DNA-3-methyladenine glycosylase